jgi:hypothetical protein
VSPRTSFGSLLARRPGRSSVDVDPVMAALLGIVVVGGGGLAAYGATQDTQPGAAPVAVVQQDDPVVQRALEIVRSVDGTAADGEGASASAVARERRRALRASAKGAGTDPFAAITSGTDAVTGVTANANPAAGGSSARSTGAGSAASGSTSSSSGSGGGSSSGSGATSARAQAERAAAQSAAANAAAGADGTSTTTTTTTAPPTLSAAAARDAALRAVARRPARVSLRIKTPRGTATRSRRSIGLLVPNETQSVARVVAVSKSNEVVTLRLRTGAALTGTQSKGTRCTQRLRSGACRLVRVRTGRTAVIRAPRTAKGTQGAVTALRVIGVWRGGFTVAD